MVIPIVYSEKFYKDVLDPSLDDINKLSTSRTRTAGRSPHCSSPVRLLPIAVPRPQSHMPISD